MPTLPTQPFYQDGDYTTPVLVWTSPKRYPLAQEGDVSTYEYTRRYLVAWAAYAPTQPGTADPLDPTAFLVAETPPQGSRTPLAEFERSYCRVPNQLVTASSQFITPPAPPVTASGAYNSLYFLLTNGNTEVYYMRTCTDAGLATAPTGGTFTLTFNGQTTSALAYNASTATIQTALRALSSATNWGTGLTVTGSTLGIVSGPVVNLVSNFTLTPTLTQNGNALDTTAKIFKSSLAVSGYTVINAYLLGVPLGGTMTFSFMGETTSAVDIYGSSNDLTAAILALPKLNSNGACEVEVTRTSIIGTRIYMATPPVFTSVPAGVVVTQRGSSSIFDLSGTAVQAGDSFTFKSYGASKLPVRPLCRYRLKPYFSLDLGNLTTATSTITYNIYNASLVLVSTISNPSNYEIDIPSSGAFVEVIETVTITYALSVYFNFLEFPSYPYDNWNRIISGSDTSYVSQVKVKIPTSLSLSSSLTGPSSPYSGKIDYYNTTIFGAQISLASGGRLLTTPSPHRAKIGSRIIAKTGTGSYGPGETYDINSEIIISARPDVWPFNAAGSIVEVGTLQAAFAGTLRIKTVEITDFYLTGPDNAALSIEAIQPTTQALSWFRFYKAIENGDTELVLDETDVQRWKGPIYFKKLTKISLEGLA